MLKIGLTGGIGSGKSEVAAVLSRVGAHVIEADELARRLVEPGGTVLAELVERFGRRILNGDGTLDRAALADLAFGSSEGLAALNEITHPPLLVAIIAEAEAFERADPEGVLVVDAALLAEWNILDLFDIVVVVRSRLSDRIARLMRGGLSRDDVSARICSQAPGHELEAAADIIIDNTGTLEELEEKVRRLWASLGVAEEGQ